MFPSRDLGLVFGIVEHVDGCLAWVNRKACTDQIRKNRLANGYLVLGSY